MTFRRSNVSTFQRSHVPKVAVVGAGYWGKNLVRNFHQLGALGVICDSDPACLSRYEEPYPEVPKRLACSDVFRDPTVQAVAIATPAETHYTLAKEALLAGKDVFVEKPLCLEEEQAAELIALASERQRVLMVGHLLRYHPAFVKLQELVEIGELGRVYYIYSNRLNLGRIRREENILWSFAPHDVSAILALAGEMPEKVVSRGGNYLDNVTFVIASGAKQSPSRWGIASAQTARLAMTPGVKSNIVKLSPRAHRRRHGERVGFRIWDLGFRS